ncbi:MAG TPA: hypothetical protein VHD31_00825 [Candidatus Paceibacterota bacterium]|nr:hypothetical protein [Candidatus Paceibacterota bacterium]
MSISELEFELKSRRAPYEKNEDGSLVLRAESKSCIYPVLFTPSGDHIQALVWFPATQRLVSDAKGLCRSILAHWVSGMDIGFEFSNGKFYAGAFLTPQNVWAQMDKFVMACDILTILFKRAGELGTWDGHLIDLAFTPVERLPPQ